MEIKKYRLQSEMEHLKEGNQDWFKDYLRSVLESDKPVYAKTDYIATSIKQLENQISYVNDEIKELQSLKKNLTDAKELAMQLTASVLHDYGIDKLEGTTVSSITITPQKVKTSKVITIKNEQAVLGLGYVSFSPDYKAIEQAIETKSENLSELMQFIDVNTLTVITPEKIKINNKRAVNSTKKIDDEIIIEENVA
jgi:hypothetical protein